MFIKKIGIDLGTINTLVIAPDKGVLVEEPSVVALDLDDEDVVAIGKKAQQMLGRTPESLISYRPLRDGVIADFQVTEAMLKHYINTALGRFKLLKPDVMVSIPAGATSTERKAVIDATIEAGARTAYLIPEPVAAALGAEVPIAEPTGNMIIDIGGGTTEIAVISLGGIVAQASVRLGGDKLNTAITEWLRQEHNLAVGDQTAAKVKHQIASAKQLDDPSTMEVQGRDIIEAMPKTVTVSSNDLQPAVDDILDRIILAIRSVLEETPPELASDIIDRGIILTGGGALLGQLDEKLSEVFDVPIIIAPDPLQSVAKGISIALENVEDYKKSLFSSKYGRI